MRAGLFEPEVSRETSMLSHISSGEQSAQPFPKELVTGQYYGLNVESLKKRSKRECHGESAGVGVAYTATGHPSDAPITWLAGTHGLFAGLAMLKGREQPEASMIKAAITKKTKIL